MVNKQGPPPPYNPSTQDSAASFQPPPRRYPPPANVKPTNLITISSHSPVRGAWIVDPDFTPPVALMAPSPGYQDRDNASIETHDGDVNADIFVLPSSCVAQSKISIRVTSWSGSACVRVHDTEPQSAACTRRPLNIMIRSASKKADVYVPRSFKGPLQLFTDSEKGKVCYSKAVKAQITPISSVDGAHKCFLGDFKQSDWNDSGRSWPGDCLKVDTKEAINIYYDDEGNIPTKDTNGSECIMM